MEFESPDVEKDFPGLYASESVRKCNESDCKFSNSVSDEAHDKSFKKDLIIGKKKERKDSKKDKGYATLEGESSPDEDLDSRSPCKSKKSKSFKFSTKKNEKREKSREKDMEKKDGERDKKKEKDKKEKEKVKHKEKKKVKAGEEVAETNEDFPIFGVDLSTAIDRNGCLDGVPIPLVVRNCIDCIHSFGLNMEGLYKVVAMKSKVQNFKKAYNSREPVSMGECDVPIAACLLRMFLRELPEPILTNELLAQFEEAGAVMEVDARERDLQFLLTQLPVQNRVLLGWLVVHFDTVTMHEKQNKLNAQSIAMTFSPVLQMSHRLLTAFLCHCKSLFPDIVIERYVPPLCPGSSFPETPDAIAIELKKQESLLNQIHKEMSEGFVSKKKEEQLWEVQRIVTQLKRKLKGLQRFHEASVVHKSMEEEHPASEEAATETKKQLDREDIQNKPKGTNENFTERVKCEEDTVSGNAESRSTGTISEDDTEPVLDSQQDRVVVEKESGLDSVFKFIIKDKNLEDFKEQLEYEELLKFQSLLQERINKERELIAKLNSEIQTYTRNKTTQIETNKSVSWSDSELDIEKLSKDYGLLQKKMRDLTLKIFEERLACVKLKVFISILEMPEKEG